MINNVALVAGVQQSNSYVTVMHIHISIVPADQEKEVTKSAVTV